MRSEYDLVVIGGGPAGMASAIAASENGLSVLMIDEQNAPGGQIWRAVERNAGASVGDVLGSEYLKGAKLAKRLRASKVELCLGAQVWQIEDGFTVYFTVDGMAQCLGARAVLLATGAQERPNPFPGWKLPGVMTVGAAQILIKNAAQIPDEPVWIAGTGPLPLLYMSQLLGLGGKVAGFVDTAPRGNFWRAARALPRALSAPKGLFKGGAWLAKLRMAGVPFYGAAHGLEAIGDQKVEAVRFKKANGTVVEAPAKLLLAHEGVVPNVHYTMALGCQHDWDGGQLCFAPRLDKWGETTRPGLFVAGDGGGIAGADAAVELGMIAGLGIAMKLGVLDDKSAQSKASAPRKALRRHTSMRPFLDALYQPRTEIFSPADATIVCRCECRTAGQVRKSASIGPPDTNAVKAATRAGMGPCQGRQCGYSIQALVAETHHLPRSEVSFFNIRPPLKPVTLGEMAMLETQQAT